MAVLGPGNRHDAQARALLDQVEVEKAIACTKPLVSFLQRDHVGVEFRDDVGGP
jgi:hypothetical protein